MALVLAPLALMPLPAGATVSTLGPYHPTDGVLDGGTLQTDPTGNADTSNYGGGSKEDDTCPTVAVGTASPKDDLDKVWFDSASSSGDVIAYMAWHRLDTSGTTTIDFELNRLGGAAPGCFNRSDGDILFTYDFQGSGPFTLDITAHRWDGTNNKWVAFVLPAGSSLAGINADGSFGELAVDLTLAGLLDSDACQDFTSASTKTRSSSSSFNSEIKDWTLPLGVTISNCGHINVHKTDDAGAPLAGAVFALYADNAGHLGSAVVPAQACTTDASGDCSILDIHPGTYWVVETTTPAGHTTADPRQVVVAVDSNDPANPLTFVDPRLPATVNIVKHDDTGANLAGATFGLYTDNNGIRGTAVAGKTCITSGAGTCSITGILPPGTYWLHETGVPDGYTAAADQSVTLALNQTVTLTFVDNRIPATVNIVKHDDAGANLAGATFGLYTDNNGIRGTAVAGKTCITSGAGTCSITGILPPGTYWLHETVVPTGYTVAADQSVTLHLADTVTLTFVDNRIPATVNIVKHDDTGANLAGATFGLYTDSSGHIGSPVAGKSCETNGAGECSIGGILPPGTYWLHETVVPAGYSAAPDQQVTLGLAQTLEVDFVDGRLPATVNIVKHDDAGAALSGATFGLYTDSSGHIGSPVAGKSCETNGAGECSIGGILPPGTYWLHETVVPAGYTAAADQQVTLALNQTVTLPAFVDNRIPATVNIVKHDDTGANLAGATFGLYTDSSGHIGSPVAGKSCETNGAGECSIGGILPPGTYWLHETGVPAGYTAAADQSVTLGLAQTVTLTFVDNRIPATVNIVKHDDTGANLAGATFGLYTDSSGHIGSPVAGKSCETNGAGECSIGGILPPGTYWLHETVVPAGYTVAADQSVTLHLAETVTLTFVDNRIPATVNIVKTDDVQAPLAGATFALYTDNEGERGSAVAGKSCQTNGAGLCSIGGILPPGTYWLHETVVPTGYAAAADQSVTLHLAETVTLTFVDPRLPVHVAIHKIDDAEAPVVGAVFTLYGSGEEGPGEPVGGSEPNTGSCTTDANGNCTLAAIVSAGHYWVVETVTPAGYVTAPAQVVDLAPGQSLTGEGGLTFTDQRMPSSIGIVKQVNGLDTSAEEPLTVESGAALTYTITVTNTGEIPLTVKALEDSLHANLPADCDAGLGDVVDPGDHITCSYDTVAADPGSPGSIVHNHVSVTGEDQFGRRPSADDDAWVHVLVPVIHIVKTGPATAHVGDTVTWTLTVTNPGNIGLQPVTVTDPLCDASAPARTNSDADGVLSPGETWTYQCSHVVTADDGTRILNTADVSGIDPLETKVTDSASFPTDILKPAIAITKTGPSTVHVGDPVVYTLVVTNPGNTALADVTVTDPKCDGAPVRSTDDADGLLSPGEAWTYHCTHVATAGDGASILNTATAQGTDPLGETVNNNANHTVAVLHPAITIDKTADPVSISGSGSVTYTYLVTNTGDTTLFNVLVTDDILGPIGQLASLDPGQSATLFKTVDVDTSTPPTNIGTAVGTDVLGEQVTASDSATITVVLAEVAARPAPAQELPRTGAPLQAETRAALALIEVGLLLELSAWRRRRIRRRAD